MSSAFRAVLIASFASTSLMAQQDYVPRYKLPEGREIVVVYIGGQNCVACHLPEVKAAVREMKAKVAVHAVQQRAAFSAVAVAEDWDVDTAAAFLKDLGRFDQIVLGGNWTNLAIERYVWRDTSARGALPQIVVIERTVSPLGSTITFSEPRVLRRISGGKDIPEWNAAGAPISAEVPRRP